MSLAEPRIQCGHQRPISDMEDRVSGARKRDAAGSVKALERPLGLVATSQEALKQGPWRL